MTPINAADAVSQTNHRVCDVAISFPTAPDKDKNSEIPKWKIDTFAVPDAEKGAKFDTVNSVNALTAYRKATTVVLMSNIDKCL